MGILDILVTIMSIVSIVIIFLNMRGGDFKVRVRSKCGSEEAVLGGRLVRPLIYVGGLPETEPPEGVGERIAGIIRQTGLNATIAFTLVREEKSRLLRSLEREIEKARMALEATKSPRYAERLRFLEKLYIDVARSTRPYRGGTALIVWVDDETSREEAEALKLLVEAETGIEMEEFNGSLVEALLSGESMGPGRIPDIPWLGPDNGELLVLGVNPESGALVALRYPEDIESHVAIVGPTGRGKTVLMLGLALQLERYVERGELSIVVIDPKGDLSEKVMRTHLASRLTLDPCGRPGLTLVGSVEDAKAVVARLVDCAERGLLTRRYVVLIDEAWKVIPEARSYIAGGVREGRSLGLHFIYATQSFEDIDRVMLENTGVLIVFGGPSRHYEEAARSLGIEVDGLKYLPVGTAYARIGRSRPVKVSILNFERYLKIGGSGLYSRLREEKGVNNGQTLEAAASRKGDADV